MCGKPIFFVEKNVLAKIAFASKKLVYFPPIEKKIG